MADEDDGAAAAGDVLHFAEAFFLECGVADGEDFVDEQDFGLEVRGDGEGQAHLHAGGIMLERAYRESARLRRRPRFRRTCGRFRPAHAQDGAAEENVFAAGQLGMEAGADFEQAADAPVNFRETGGGAGDASEQFEQGGLACAVASDEADDFALVDVKETSRTAQMIVLGAALAIARAAEGVGEHVAQLIAFALAHSVALADAFHADAVSAIVSPQVPFPWQNRAAFAR